MTKALINLYIGILLIITNPLNIDCFRPSFIGIQKKRASSSLYNFHYPSKAVYDKNKTFFRSTIIMSTSENERNELMKVLGRQNIANQEGKYRIEISISSENSSGNVEKIVGIFNQRNTKGSPEEGQSFANQVSDKVEKQKKPLFILCHGLLSTKTSGIIRKLSERLSFDTFAFDFRGNGESTGPWTLTGYDREVEDLRTVIEYIRNEHQEEYDIIGILGHSKGSQCVLRYGRIYDDIPFIVNLCGRFFHNQQPSNRYTKEQLNDLETKGWMVWTVKGKDYKIDQQMMNERCAVDNTLVRNIVNAKVLTIHGESDQTIPATDAYEWGKYIKNHELKIIADAGHLFEKEEEDKIVAEAIENFIREN